MVLHGIGILMPWNMFITAKNVCIILFKIYFFYIFLTNFTQIINF